MLYDAHSELNLVRMISPAAIINGNATTTSQIIDVSEYGTLEVVIQPGAVTDGTWTCSLYESDDSGMAGETAVSASDLLGSAPTLTSADANTIHKFGYIGNKRYVRFKAVQAAAAVGGYLCVIAVQTRAHTKPVA